MTRKTASTPMQRLGAVAGLLWIVAVLAAYYVENSSYYAEKLAVFGRFLFRIGA